MNRSTVHFSSVYGQQFPETFKFGAASAAYQIEGYNSADGKGPSIWDDWTKIPGKIADASSGDDGPDSYVHFARDVEILKNSGVDFYRFSISWSRIMPDGTLPSLNQAGIDYYSNLIDLLMENGIEPMVTMYHWDLPSRIHDLGGFTTSLFPLYFEQYAKVLFEHFGDRVKNWITFNEPSEFCVRGYGTGGWPPGFMTPGAEYYCIYYMQIAHAKAYHLYKKFFFESQQGRVGITFYSINVFPKDPQNPADVEAAERTQMFYLGVYAHPIFIGGFPDVVRESVDRFSSEEGHAWSRLPEYDEETLEYVKGTSDFFGLNYYTSRLAEATETPSTKPLLYDDARVLLTTDPSWPQANSDWLYTAPSGLTNLLLWIKNTYNGVETIITENGWSDAGEQEDDNRVEYLRLHLQAILDAMEEGANVIGHTTWSIIDNFEWSMGYTEKFGIHSFDPVTKVRTAKKSVAFLKQVCETHVLPDRVPTELFP